MRRSRSPVQRGFTLIEMLIVVVMIAILAAIAFPQYRDYVVRSNRAIAKSLLTQVADRQEQFYTANKRYSNGLAELGYDGDTFYANRHGQTSAASSAAIYAITLDAATDTTFTVSATVQGAQAEDTKCTKFMLNEVGQRTAEGTAADCW